MSNWFKYDSPFMVFFRRVWELFLLNVVWLLCSAPIVTAGAATTALCYVSARLVRDEDTHLISDYFKSMKENFWQATGIWTLLLGIIGLLCLDLYCILEMMTAPSMVRVALFTALVAVAIILLVMMIYVFPLQGCFRNSIKQTIRNSLILSICNIRETVCMVAMDGLIIYVAITYASALLIWGIPLLTYVNAFVLNRVFQHYLSRTDLERITSQAAGDT